MGYRGVVSSRDVNEWMVGCPIRITHVAIILEEDGKFITKVYSDVCGGFGKLSYTAKIEYKNSHKENIFECTNNSYKLMTNGQIVPTGANNLNRHFTK